MNMFLLAVILGIIEGLTEFIPVSSTGHLIIANNWLHFDGEFANLFAIVIQSGAIVAAMIYFREKIIPPFKHPERFKAYILLWLKVAIAIIPAVVLALTMEDIIDKVLFKPIVVAFALIVGAIFLIVSETHQKQVHTVSDDAITFKQALIVGIFQCLAIIFPGMSRSASTIIGGMWVGFDRKLSAEFSFLLAIPALCGASIYKLIKFEGGISSAEWQMLGVGTLVSFVVAYFVIAFFMNYIRKHDMKLFAYYRIVLGIIVLAMFYL
ncbi:MAG: undecaprenyl-diphosphatase [Clostridiales bacterium]|nr:undecaprenyl-diphosphatase [Clostridiales bacterium]